MIHDLLVVLGFLAMIAGPCVVGMFSLPKGEPARWEMMEEEVMKRTK